MSLQGQRTTTGAMDWSDFTSLIGKLERDKNYKYCLLVTIGVFTGLRIGDLLQLKFSQFEDTEILTIQEKKTKKIRRIKINEDLKEIVQRIQVKMGVEDSNRYIFLNRYNIKVITRSWANQMLKKIFKKYGIEVEGNVSSHMFRKTLGNRVLKLNSYSGESVLLLMSLFNHASPATTRRYLGLREKQVLDVYDSLRL
jgi:integrase